MADNDRGFARAELRNLGRQIRLLRERRGLSLNDLARQSGVSVTAIRNIEAGRANPGLMTMVAITGRLGLSIDEFVNRIRHANKTVHVSRAPGSAQRAPIQRQLSELYEPNLRGRMLTLPAGTDMVASRKAETGPHFAYVLEGMVQLTTKDGSAHALSAGDSIHIADQPPRIVANRGRRVARMLWVKDSRGDAASGRSR